MAKKGTEVATIPHHQQQQQHLIVNNKKPQLEQEDQQMQQQEERQENLHTDQQHSEKVEMEEMPIPRSSSLK